MSKTVLTPCSFSLRKGRQPSLLAVFLAVIISLSLTGCDLPRNQLKIDRGQDREFQDFRDGLAQRLPETESGFPEPSAVPALQPYVANPSDKLKPMPLVSISVNQTVPVRDVLYELAEQAEYDIELDPRIRGSIIFTARNRPFDMVVDRIAEISGLRYRFKDDMLRVELDTPYHEIYKINYLSYVRQNESIITNDVAVVSGEGADTGSRFRAESNSEADFWGELHTNLTQILGVNREAGTLRTGRDPRISSVEQNPAPVQPLGVDESGELVEVQPPDTVLRVESLPVDDEEGNGASGNNEDDPFAPRYSLNQQAGIISVFAPERLQMRVADYLTALKRSVTSQVLIEAKVLEVGLSDEFSAGIDWQNLNIFDRSFGLGFDANLSGFVRGILDPQTEPVSNANMSYTSGDFEAAIEAISRFGTVRALASPRLTVLNNQSAVLNVAENRVYFEIDIDVTTEDGVTQTDLDSEIRNVPEGVLINVQPAIDLDAETISMAVRPTVTRITGFVNDPAVAFVTAGLADPIESPIPVVNVQEFDSVIQMNNGQAIVMGGLIQDRAQSVQNGVPVLSEAPMIGALFRNQQDSIEKTELVVLLKATIVEGGDNIHTTDKDLYRGFSGDRRPFRM